MIIARKDTEEPPLTWATIERIEMMLISALIVDKSPFFAKLTSIKTEIEGQEMIQELMQYTPTMGYHSIPHTVEEQGRAIRYSVDKDDFQEQRWHKEF